MKRPLRERWLPSAWHWLPALALAMWAAGCTPWTNGWNSLRDTVRGKGYTDDSNTWTQNLRKPSKGTPKAGVDERARQIESSLGVE